MLPSPRPFILCCGCFCRVQFENSPGGVSRASNNLVVIQEATAGQVTCRNQTHGLKTLICDRFFKIKVSATNINSTAILRES